MHPAKRAKKKTKAEAEPPVPTQRIDRWLWHARIVKTRALAAALVASGHVRVNGRRTGSAAYAVRRQDVLTVALPTTVRVLRAIEFADRRGNAALAASLYEEIKPYR
jgi:ribosome-associated heat shock protein Hsp15